MDELVLLAYCDLAGLVRGRAVPASAFDERRTSGVGWVPANQAICCFGPLAEPNPWGSVGDLRLRPDASARVRVDLWPDLTALHLVLCDAVTTDGTPWDACPRAYVRRAIADLKERHGLTVVASFEHEFQLVDDVPPTQPFTLAGLRSVEPFGPMVVAALREAGAEPEMFLPEYGPRQFEVLVRPAAGMASADRAVIVKEVVREVARRLGRVVTFAPLTAPGGIGNGVHVHLSLRDDAGRPVLHDPTAPGGLSTLGGSFAAGLLAHLPALLALTAPSAISYARLRPHQWSAGTPALGYRNREAAVRIAPVDETADAARQFNIEFRGADATANPYLVLGALLNAGLDGVAAQLAPPPLLDRDPSTLDAETLAAYVVGAVPADLDEALAALAADDVIRATLPADLYACYRSLKAAEQAELQGLELADACRRYAAVH